MNVPAGKRVALLIEDEFDDSHVTRTSDALRQAGVEVVLVGPAQGVEYRARGGDAVAVSSLAAGRTRAADFDAVLVPGGHAPDRMRLRHAMVDLVRDAVALGKPVAAIDHGPALLISAGVVRGRTLTCWPSIAIDVKNAGGRYVDRPVVDDRNVITARKSDDLPSFTAALLKALGLPAPATL